MIFRAPRVDDDGNLLQPPCITVFHNGIVVQNNVSVERPTRASMANDMRRRGPIMLQDHGDPVRYRNIWVRELD
ncbi:MAG: 3-keto-disaccharide hydrolase [Planctomycetota bacterium]